MSLLNAKKFDNSRKSRFLLVCSQLKELREEKSISLSSVARKSKRQLSQVHGIETPQPTEANMNLLESYLEGIDLDEKEIQKIKKYIETGK